MSKDSSVTIILSEILKISLKWWNYWDWTVLKKIKKIDNFKLRNLQQNWSNLHLKN